MPTTRLLTLRIAIAALIWASALLAPAAATQIMPQHPAHENVVATGLDAGPAARISYRYNSSHSGPSTPGPTDPNAPSF